jgi:hypothetical protein
MKTGSIGEPGHGRGSMCGCSVAAAVDVSDCWEGGGTASNSRARAMLGVWATAMTVADRVQ